MADSTPEHELDKTVGADLVRGGLWTAVSAGVGIPLGVVSNVVLARALGPAGLGVYGQIIVVWSLVSMFVNTGVSAASVQWMALSRGRRDQAGFLQVVSVCSAYHLLLQAPVLALAAVVLTRDSPIWVVLLAAASTFAVQAMGTASVVMSGAARNARAAQIGIIFNLLRVGVMIGAALWLPDPAVVWGLTQVAGVVSIVMSWRSLQPAEKRAVWALRGSWPWPAGFARFARNVGIAGLASSLVFGRSELLILGFYDQATAAGLFVVATAIASLITIPLDSLMGPLAPAAAYYTGASRDRAADILERSVHLSAVLAGATAVVAPAAIIVSLPLLYGDTFASAVGAAIVLAFLSLVQSVLNPMATFTLAADRSGALLVLSVVSAAVDVAVALVLVPLWGLSGAVAASVCGQVLHLLGATELASRATSSTRARLVRRSAPLLVGLAIAGATAAAALLQQAAWCTILLGAGGLLAYRAALALHRPWAIPTDEWDRLLRTVGSKTRIAGRLARVLLGSGA